MKIGFSYQEALDQPVAMLQTLMAIEQIKTEGARPAFSQVDVFDNETMDIWEAIPDLK